MLDKPLRSIVYDDVWGVNVRFRDGIYDLTTEESAAIRNYIDAITSKAALEGSVSAEDFSDFVSILEILARADRGKAVLLCQYAYDRVLHLER